MPADGLCGKNRDGPFASIGEPPPGNAGPFML